LLITFEGGEGSGKTTCSRALYDWIKDHHKKEVIWTREPGGTELGKTLRGFALNPDLKSLGSQTELLLMLTDRSQHLHELICPNLNQGKIVISDRYMDSNMVYQGLVNKAMQIDLLFNLSVNILGFIQPNLTFYYKVDPEIGLRRAAERNKIIDNKESKYDNKKLKFHKQLAKSYDWWFNTRRFMNERMIITIDSNQPLTLVISETIRSFDLFFKDLVNAKKHKGEINV